MISTRRTIAAPGMMAGSERSRWSRAQRHAASVRKETPMQSSLDLWLNVFCAVVFPLLILANLAGWGTTSPASTYLWREEPGLMRVSMVVIGILALWSMAQIALRFGLIGDTGLNAVMVALGVPFLVAAVGEIWLAARALLRYRRRRADGLPR